MQKLSEQLNNLLYNYREKLLGIIRIASGIQVTLGMMLLVYRFGFLPAEEEMVQLLKFFDALFATNLLFFALRWLLAIEKKKFVSSTWFESSLNFLILINGIIYYLTEGYNLLMETIFSFNLKFPMLAYHHILSVFLLILIFLELTKFSTKISELELKPATTFINSFILLIFIGTLLLMLPAMTTQKGSMPFIDALFISVSASCVTGLAVVDISTYFTMKGQLIILFLFQLGGIGIVSFATFFASFLAKGVSLKHQSIIQDFLSSESLDSAKDLLKKIVLMTVLIELCGTIAIFFSWDDELKFSSIGFKFFYSFFHAVSAFCNAGFSLFSDGLFTNDISMGNDVFAREVDINLRQMYSLHFIIAIMIFFGSVGFSTIEDIFSKSRKGKWIKPREEWRIGTKVALYSSLALILIGTIGFMVLEAHQLTDRTIVEALITSFFQSVTTRTAGFHTMNFGGMDSGIPLANPTLILVIFLMFIGAAPGSTGGGIKNTTFLVLVLAAIANIKGRER
ncbi:MAG: potassium transporter TrkG, partial [Bacteroidota bacterium]